MSLFPPARAPKGQHRRKAPARRRVPVHVFVAEGAVDWRGVGICTCGSAKDATVHDVPPTPDEAAAIDQRRTGERD